MAFRSFVFLFLVLSVVQSHIVQVPVFLWGDLQKISPKSNPLTTVSTGDFTNLVGDELEEDPFTVVFIEETLSVEDFSRKNSDGETDYPYLHSIIGHARYISSVEDPLTALTKLSGSESVDHVKLTENSLSAEIEPQGKYLFINLKDALEGENRHDLLRRHNDFMQDMYGKLKNKYDKVIAIYTAYNPSWTLSDQHRVRRQAETPEKEIKAEEQTEKPAEKQAEKQTEKQAQTQAQSVKEYTYEGLKMFLEKAVMYNENQRVELSAPATGTTMFTNDTQTTTLIFTGNSSDSQNLTFHFTSQGGYWWFDQINLNLATYKIETLEVTKEVYAIEGFSYACMQSIVFKTNNNVNETNVKNYNITLTNMRIQPFFNLNTTENVFGDPNYCVGFFSIPIWTGLFVVFILLAITFFGITMMMDIRTMDRFDDPKGKTITINAVGE